MKPYIRNILIGIVVVIAALAVWKGISRPGTNQQQNAQIPTTSVAPLASVTPITLTYDTPPADWKSYSSTSAGFKVSYPADWTVGSCGAGCTGWAPAGAPAGQFALGIIRSSGSLDDLIKKAQPFLAKKEDVKAGANTWMKLTLQQPTTGDVVTSHFIAHNGMIFEFGTATTDAAILASYGKMIASFVFLK